MHLKYIFFMTMHLKYIGSVLGDAMFMLDSDDHRIRGSVTILWFSYKRELRLKPLNGPHLSDPEHLMSLTISLTLHRLVS